MPAVALLPVVAPSRQRTAARFMLRVRGERPLRTRPSKKLDIGGRGISGRFVGVGEKASGETVFGRSPRSSTWIFMQSYPRALTRPTCARTAGLS